MNYLEQIVRLAEKWSVLGERTLGNGTRLIGHVPHVAPQAYLNQFFYPQLVGGEFDVVEMFVGRPMPRSLRELYSAFNGFALFSDDLCVYGLRRSHTRTIEDAWQPFAIQTPNTVERPLKAPEDVVFFGGYGDDLTLLGMSPKSPRVFATSPNRWKVKAEWPDLETCLVQEADRLAALYDAAGKFIGIRGRVSPGSY